MCVALCIAASMLAWKGMRYASGSVILLSNLISTIVRCLRVLFALVVHPTKHEYVNGVNTFHSMQLCLLSLSNSVLTISWSFGPFGRFTVVSVLVYKLGLNCLATSARLPAVSGIP